MPRHPTNLAVQVELPEDAVQGRDLDALADELRVLWLLDQVRHHRLSAGRAAELAALPLSRFLELMAQHRIPVIDLDDEALRDELDAARSLGH